MKKYIISLLVITVFLVTPIHVFADEMGDGGVYRDPEDTVTNDAQFKEYLEEFGWTCKKNNCTNDKGQEKSKDDVYEEFKKDSPFRAWFSENHWECKNRVCKNKDGKEKSIDNLQKDYEKYLEDLNKAPDKESNYWDNLPGENELVCNHLMTERLAKLLGKIYRTIIMLALVGVVVLGMMDFVKATGSDNADEMKKAWKRFLNRLIIAVLLVMLPTLLEFIFTLFGNSDMKNCLNYF